ncbi:MAG: phospho-sugar mutase [Spirochaetaceae bacterium]|nr:phospho-sugar mutase [Spirochaetaceae bacterium]
MTNEEIRTKAETYLKHEENQIFRDEVTELLKAEDWEQLSDRFWRELDFGTGGLRGLIGGGDNRMNTYVIRKATQGLANYILSHVAESERGVVIAYDSRRFSDLFAEEAARVMAANHIRTWLFTSLRPTPELSFAVRQFGACAGIMVTASHNPAAYNGYKVFWSDGAQVVPPHDKGIIGEVRNITGDVPAMDRKEADKAGLIISVDREVDEPYHDMVVGQSLNPDLVKAEGKNLKVVFTPLHGTGLVPVETVLGRLGIDVVTVPEQREPDGNFPTISFPNPEMAPALKMALDLAKDQEADLVMATDPDADRLGIAVPDSGEWKLISGNQLGSMLADYIFRTRKSQGRLPANPAFVNTIVTSEIQNRIAESYGATCFRVLTGFKYIGEKIRQFEADNTYSYVFGGEESYGFLVGTAVRDKDAVSAASMTAEMALWNRNRGKSVMDHLRELWAKFGFWKEILISRDFEGQKGQDIMASLMDSLREDPPKEIASVSIEAMRDFRNGTTTKIADGSVVKDIMLPSSDVLQFVLADGSLVTARPSGTEPKVKFYASCRSEKGSNPGAAEGELDGLFSGIENWVNVRIKAVGG